jgi:hypothetical protein
MPSATVVRPPSPIRYALFVDQTRSNRSAGINRVTASSFAPITGRLLIAGGDIAFGVIRDAGNPPLVRIFVPPPPAPPVPRQLPNNLFLAASAKREADAAQAEFAARYRLWRNAADASVASFMRDITPLLLQKEDAPQTDLRSVLQRADVFFREPTTLRLPQQALILVTDGVETATPGALPVLGGSVTVIVVNGTPTVGDLEPLHPLHFEALDAALRYLVSKGDHHA